MKQIARFPTPPKREDYIAELEKAIHSVYANSEIDIISIAIPGVIENNHVVRCANLDWHDFDIISMLQPHFGDVPIIIENDSNLGGLGEVRSLDPIPHIGMYVTVSTGIGCGVIVDGKIQPGMRNLSEAGHMLLEYDGAPKEWEDFASGKAIMQRYKKLASEIESEKDWKDITERISRGFMVLLPAIRPDITLIGGGVGAHFDKFGPGLRQIIDETVPEHTVSHLIVQAKHPEEAVVYGCYYHAIDHLTS